MFLSVAAKDVPIGKIEMLSASGPAGTIGMRAYTPVAAGGAALPAILFFHGGGWVLGDLDIYDALCRMLANESGARVLSVDYRLAPEHPFPGRAGRLLRRAEMGGGERGRTRHRCQPHRGRGRFRGR